MNETADCHAFEALHGPLGEDRLNHMTVDIGQSTIEPVVIVSELLVIEAEQVKDGRIKIPDGGRVDLAAASKGSGGPMARSTADARPEHPAGKTIRVVVAAGRPGLMGGHPAELGRPEYERIVEHSALGQIGDQGGGRLIENG